MFDVALSSAGAQISQTTSSDENYPPENMLDGMDETFWSSTGLFPQEVVISFQTLMNIDNISISSYNIKHLVLERSVQNEPTDFETLEEKEMERTDQHQQQVELNISSNTAQHLKLLINSGYDDFIGIYKVKVNGTAVNN